MKRLLLRIWRILPFWMQRLASAIIRPHYQVAVGGLVFNDRVQLLLCKHTYRRTIPWGLPGGDLKYGEDPAEAVRRELKEETGLTVQVDRLLLVKNFPGTHHFILTYLCTGVAGEFVANEEVAEIRYFDLDRLPELSEEEQITVDRALAILNFETRKSR